MGKYKAIKVIPNTFDDLTKFCKEHQISKVGMMEKIIDALVNGSNAFWSWGLLMETVREAVSEEGITSQDEVDEKFKNGLSMYTSAQINKALSMILPKNKKVKRRKKKG